MAQLSISFGIELGNLPVNQQVEVKVSHKAHIAFKVNEKDLNWGDIYDEYEDFEYTSQSWSK